MEKKVDFLKQNRGREFGLLELEELRVFPWALNNRTIKKMIALDSKFENILQAKVRGAGSQRRYAVRGENIIRFIKKNGDILTRVARAKSNYVRSKKDKGGGKAR